MAETVERAEDIEKKDGKGEGTVKRWLMELELSSKREKNWREKADKIESIYLREKEKDPGTRFNVLWSNTEILRPSLLSDTPRPDVRRRHNSENPIARVAAMTLERALSFSIDDYDFGEEIDIALLDSLLTGRGVVWAQYAPKKVMLPSRVALEARAVIGEDGTEMTVFIDPSTGQPVTEGVQQDEAGAFIDGPPEPVVVDETVHVEHVPWDDYREGPARGWRKMPWVGRRRLLNRDQLVNQFAEGEKVKLHVELGETTAEQRRENEEIFKRAEVWEIWDKAKKRVVWVSEGHKQSPLTRIGQEDGKPPFDLKGFFPVPEPLLWLKTGRKRIPKPEYELYEDLAKELDDLTVRISRLVSAIKVRGLYNNSIPQLQRLLTGPENKMIGVDDWSQFAAAGGMRGAVDWVPIDMLVQALTGLLQERNNIIATIFQVTGISDIQRGATDPRETKGAQQLKAQFGSLRLARRQKRVQRFVKEVFRIKAEIIAEKFAPETLERITGIQQLPEASELMSSDQLRSYTIDIETDTTVAADEQADKQSVTEFLGALGGFLNQAGPMVQQGVMPAEVATTIMLWASRRFKVSREVEELLEQIGRQPQQQEGQEGDNGQAAAAMMKTQVDAQAKAAQLGLDQQKMQIDMEKFSAEQFIEAKKLELEERRLSLEEIKANAEVQLRHLEIAASSRTE